MTEQVVHPAQDFKNGLMSFTVKVGDMLYLVTSRRELISCQKLPPNIKLKHQNADIFSFSPRGVLEFKNSNRSVNPHNLFLDINTYLKKYIRFRSEEQCNFIALWVMLTYVFMIFRTIPYPWINGEMNSGKTTLLSVLKPIVFNGETSVNDTQAAIFRDTNNNLLTLMIDEAENFQKPYSEAAQAVMALLRRGNEKDAIVRRCETDTNKIIRYQAYSPKVLSGIRDLEPTLRSRTIRVHLVPRKASEKVEEYNNDTQTEELQKKIRDDLYIFALTHASEIAEAYAQKRIEDMKHLINRESAIWKPHFVLAGLVDLFAGGTGLTDAMTRFSLESYKDKQEDNLRDNEGLKLLEEFKTYHETVGPMEIIEEGKIGVYNAQKLLAAFKESGEFSWLDEKNENTHKLTRRLKNIDIGSDQWPKNKSRGSQCRVYLVDYKKVQENYLRNNLEPLDLDCDCRDTIPLGQTDIQVTHLPSYIQQNGGNNRGAAIVEGQMEEKIVP